MDIYHRFSAVESPILRGLEALKAKKDAFHALLPGPLAALGNPQGVIHDKLLALKTSIVNFKLAIFGVFPASVGEISVSPDTAWTNSLSFCRSLLPRCKLSPCGLWRRLTLLSQCTVLDCVWVLHLVLLV